MFVVHRPMIRLATMKLNTSTLRLLCALLLWTLLAPAPLRPARAQTNEQRERRVATPAQTPAPVVTPTPRTAAPQTTPTPQPPTAQATPTPTPTVPAPRTVEELCTR